VESLPGGSYYFLGGNDMKVKVKDIPVFIDGKRYVKDDTLTIKEEHFNDSLFQDESPKSKRASKDEEK
jgi:hypothetical protein